MRKDAAIDCGTSSGTINRTSSDARIQLLILDKTLLAALDLFMRMPDQTR